MFRRTLPLATTLMLLSGIVAAQSAPASQPAGAGRLTFEVASIKQNKSGSAQGGADAQPGGRVTLTNTSLFDFIRYAYGLQRSEMVTGERVPSWITSERWDVLARGPEQADQQQLRTMLQNLLVDRFKLIARREVRDVPVYALVLARSDRRPGPQLRPSTADCAALAAAARAADAAPGSARVCGRNSGGDAGGAFISGIGVPLADFVRTLSASAGRVVVDATGLAGVYDLDLKWTPDQPPGADSVPANRPSLFTAIQDQLGLRLEPRQVPIEVFFIESAERPAED
jgi:uncharacterized protein (TIGR03435 family)